MITNVTLLQDGRHSGEKKDWNRSYTACFLVECNDPRDGPEDVLTHLSLPQIGQPYIISDGKTIFEQDWFALCVDRTIDHVPDALAYKVTCQWSTERDGSRVSQNSQGKPENQSQDKKPNERPWGLTGSTRMVDTILTQDYTPATEDPPGPLPVKNSANDKFEHPFMVQRARTVINVNISRSQWFLAQKKKFDGTVNSKPYMIHGETFDAETLLVTSYNFKRASDKYGDYFNLDISLEYARETHKLKILDVGVRELIFLDGSWVHKKILDDDGNPKLTQLNGNGRILPLDGSLQAVYLVRRPYPLEDFNAGLV